MNKSRTARTLTTIPDAWLMGFMQGHRDATIQDAVAYWQDQARLAAEFEAQRANS